jgi:hypothetical protein
LDSFFGMIPVSYERALSDLFSVQVTVGATSRNYLREFANNLESKKPRQTIYYWNDGSTDDYYDENSYYEFDNRKASAGYTFSIQPRIYFNSEGLDGSFLGLSYDMTQFNFSSQKIVTGNSSGDLKFTNEYFSEYDKYSDITITAGYQTLYDRISFETSAGLAVRSTKGKRYAYSVNNGEYIDGYSTFKKSAPAFLVSFRVGYHF